MKKLNFKWLVVLCMAMGFATVAKAQIYCSEVCFYQNIDNPNKIIAIKFENSRIHLLVSNVKQNIATSIDFYNNDAVWDYSRRSYFHEYDPKASTVKYEVYKWHCNGTCDAYGNPIDPAHMRYYAFSKDLSSFIWWSERDVDGEMFDKSYFVRISKEDILSNAVNRDFLND